MAGFVGTGLTEVGHTGASDAATGVAFAVVAGDFVVCVCVHPATNIIEMTASKSKNSVVFFMNITFRGIDNTSAIYSRIHLHKGLVLLTSTTIVLYIDNKLLLEIIPKMANHGRSEKTNNRSYFPRETPNIYF
jgi:hypothetical protein